MGTANEFGCSLCRLLYLQIKRRQYNINCGDLPCPFTYLNAIALSETDCDVDPCVKISLFTPFEEDTVITINCDIYTEELPEVECSGPYLINL